MIKEIVKIETEFIKLDQLLKWAGIAGTGTDAKYLISTGLVSVNDQVIMQRGKKIYPGDMVEIELDEKIQLKVDK